MYKSLLERQEKQEEIRVYKFGDEKGDKVGSNIIADLSHSVLDNNKKEEFRDLIAVKSDYQFKDFSRLG